jgi:hypothetical protein
MEAIILAILPTIVELATRLIAFAFDQHYLNVEQKKAFLNFVETMSKKDNDSTESVDVFSKLHAKLKDGSK